MGTVHLPPDDRKKVEKLMPDTFVALKRSGLKDEMRGLWLLLVLVAAAQAERVFIG